MQGTHQDAQTLSTMALPFKSLSESVFCPVGAFKDASVKAGAGCPTSESTEVVWPVVVFCAGVKSCVQSKTSSPTFKRLTTTNMMMLRLRLCLRAGAGDGAGAGADTGAIDGAGADAINRVPTGV